MRDPKEFVASLFVPRVNALEGFAARGMQVRGLESAEEDKAEAYVNNKSLVAFVAEVSPQTRKDILNSSLLAQRVADHFFPEQQQLIDWYDKYIEVMTGVGWAVEQKEFANYESASGLFEMESAVIGVLTALAGQNYAALISSTLNALKGLADDDGIIQVFEKNTHSLQKGNFQIGMAAENNGAVSMQIGAFMLETSDNIQKILFFKSNKEKTKLSFYTIRCTLNDAIYSLVRNDILEKLGESTKQYIAKLPNLAF